MPRLRSTKVSLGSSRREGSSTLGSSRWSIWRWISRIDSFGRDVPTTNIGGNPEVNTAFGGVLTLFIVSVTLAYASTKLIELKDNTNPVVNDVLIPNHFSPLR